MWNVDLLLRDDAQWGDRWSVYCCQCRLHRQSFAFFFWGLELELQRDVLRLLLKAHRRTGFWDRPRNVESKRQVAGDHVFQKLCQTDPMCMAAKSLSLHGYRMGVNISMRQEKAEFPVVSMTLPVHFGLEVSNIDVLCALRHREYHFVFANHSNLSWYEPTHLQQANQQHGFYLCPQQFEQRHLILFSTIYIEPHPPEASY